MSKSLLASVSIYGPVLFTIVLKPLVKRENDIGEGIKLRWPHFTMIRCLNPTASWAPPPALIIDSEKNEHIEFSDQDREAAMKELANTMN
jgi:hypothetical protein